MRSQEMKPLNTFAKQLDGRLALYAYSISATLPWKEPVYFFVHEAVGVSIMNHPLGHVVATMGGP